MFSYVCRFAVSELNCKAVTVATRHGRVVKECRYRRPTVRVVIPPGLQSRWLRQRRSLGRHVRCGRRHKPRNPARVGGMLYVEFSYLQGRSRVERTQGLTLCLRAIVSQARLWPELAASGHINLETQKN